MKRRSLATTVALATLLGTTPALAEGDAPGRWYIAPMVSYISADDDRKADNAVGLHLGIGKQIDSRWNIELGLVADTLDLESGSGEYKQLGLMVDGLYFFRRDDALSYYGIVGAGALRTKYMGDRETALAANLGAGLLKPVGPVDLRAEVRYRLDEEDRVPWENHFGDWLINLGLIFPFGGESGSAPQAAPQPADSDGDGVADSADQCPGTPAGASVDGYGCQPDSDGDGVIDSADRCPNTPAATRVDDNGCPFDRDGDGVADGQDRCPNTPAGARVDERGCELDSDGDGIADSADRCPDSPAGEAVNEQGCPRDSDGDGIVDAQDQCPATKAGVQVDEKGCELEAVIVLEGVTFESGSATLTPGSLKVLDEVARTLKRYPALVIEVGGHTDDRGRAAFNQRLSAERAQAVVDYLVGQGIDAGRLKARGYGESKPIADNATEEGRARNRRVEMQILQR